MSHSSPEPGPYLPPSLGPCNLGASARSATEAVRAVLRVA